MSKKRDDFLKGFHLGTNLWLLVIFYPDGDGGEAAEGDEEGEEDGEAEGPDPRQHGQGAHLHRDLHLRNKNLKKIILIF